MALSSDFQPVITTISATIANAATTTAAIDLAGTSLVAIQFPAAFTGTSVTFQASTTLSGTYQAVIDGSGTTLTKTVVAARYMVLDPLEFAGIQFIKIVSSASEAAQRDLIIVTRPL